MTTMTAEQVIDLFGLEPHLEGGWFCETFRDAATADGRTRSTAIYYLIEAGRSSQWHTVDAVESWHHYAGAPLDLRIVVGDALAERRRLGRDFRAGERPQAIVPPGAWQSATALGPWSLVGCVVAPGFEYRGFHVASPDEVRRLDAVLAPAA